ncbi:Glucomannan 4-beta-mannosyltransferase 9 [Acorus calamus]|uniref:glucomannan 4-beta-mannosyltransferase n=2 Tax=Magnoliopsida TaxID=3398 RepID=A0AAV9FDZ4_ACOCL|nr:Glucomannan 4-beta-mannosyltransferase 9 [Acorus calamus]
MERESMTALLPESFQGTRDDITEQIGFIWGQIKAPLIVPLLKVAVFICLSMSIMLFVERVYMAVVITFVKLIGYKPEKRYKWDPIRDDVELGNSAYPMVLVQIPMYNEKEVYQLSIGAACGLSWPSDRIIIQVLDDSTDPVIKNLVELECQRWASKGINIKYEIRDNRNGYKAGALKEGMKHSYVKECDYIAIFDADFQPEPDYLWRTIPFLLYNPDIALVQARWKFVNADECLMTRMQEMSLNYHFTVEQEVGSSTYAFFGFNGTAGVWRISALNEAGGWKDRTTVEDMDLAVRASLNGWKFVYVGDLKVKSELPSTFKAYRYQQHRWSCGPANLFRKMVMDIVKNKKVTLWKKIHVIYNFFFVRKIVAHIVTFIFYCVIMPATVLVPEVDIPKWGAVYIPSTITILNAIGTPRFNPLSFTLVLTLELDLAWTNCVVFSKVSTSTSLLDPFRERIQISGGMNLLLCSKLQATVVAPVTGKMFKGLCLCYMVVMSTFFSVAVSGYWAFGNRSTGIVLTNFLADGRPIVPRWFLALTNLLTVLQLSAVAVVYLQPTNEVLEGMFGDPKVGQYSTRNVVPRVMSRSVAAVAAMVLSAMLPFFGDVNALIGAFGYLPLDFVMPTVLYNVTFSPPRRRPLFWVNSPMRASTCMASSSLSPAFPILVRPASLGRRYRAGISRFSIGYLRIRAVQENNGPRRLIDIVRFVPQLSRNYFRSPSRRALFGGISLLGGFYVAQTISLSFGALGVNDVIAAVVCVLLTEYATRFYYSQPKVTFQIALLNNFKMGFTYGLFIDAFKLAS